MWRCSEVLAIIIRNHPNFMRKYTIFFSQNKRKKHENEEQKKKKKNTVDEWKNFIEIILNS